MKKPRVLTGITTTGTPHLGNFVGAIRPAIQASEDSEVESFLFLADYHSLIKCQDPDLVTQSSKEVAAAWLSLGLNPNRTIFYRQSDIPEITELTWILACCSAKGLMNRAHAYKAAVSENEESGEDADFGITMGLFSYPILMAADILLFSGERIPVGKDQIQHVEMARDIAQRFNHNFAEILTIPEAVVAEEGAVLLGLDGRKMSKSYNNIIPLFCSEKQLKKCINRIKTNLLEPGDPKNADDSAVFHLWSAFSDENEISTMRSRFEEGIGWGDAKKILFEKVNDQLAEPRDTFRRLMNDGSYIETILREGAARAREESVALIRKVRKAVGISSLV